MVNHQTPPPPSDSAAATWLQVPSAPLVLVCATNLRVWSREIMKLGCWLFSSPKHHRQPVTVCLCVGVCWSQSLNLPQTSGCGTDRTQTRAVCWKWKQIMQTVPPSLCCLALEKLYNNKVCFLPASQGDCRSYSYVCGVTSKESPHWESLMFLARLIPRMCHNINR